MEVGLAKGGRRAGLRAGGVVGQTGSRREGRDRAWSRMEISSCSFALRARLARSIAIKCRAHGSGLGPSAYVCRQTPCARQDYIIARCVDLTGHDPRMYMHVRARTCSIDRHAV